MIIYQSDDGVKLDVRLGNKTVWLNVEQIAELFNKGRSTINEHILNIFKEGELDDKVVCRKFRQTTQHGAMAGKTQSKEVKFYNLDVIISVGYRVKSIQGTRFRQWATERLNEYIVKGFTMDDERLKNLGGGNYLERIVQNKLHYAAHGHTAAEVIYERADADQPFMGLTTFNSSRGGLS